MARCGGSVLRAVERGLALPVVLVVVLLATACGGPAVEGAASTDRAEVGGERGPGSSSIPAAGATGDDASPPGSPRGSSGSTPEGTLPVGTSLGRGSVRPGEPPVSGGTPETSSGRGRPSTVPTTAGGVRPPRTETSSTTTALASPPLTSPPLTSAGSVPTSTTLTVSAERVSVGEPITLQATSASLRPGAAPPPGAVMFFEGTRVIGAAPLLSGRSTLVVRGAAIGSHPYVARYQGSPAFAPSASVPVEVTVDAALWPPPPAAGEYGYHPQTIPPYQGAGPTIALIGDSITYFDGDAFMSAARAAGLAPAYTGMPGYRLSMTKPWLDLYAASRPKVMVFNLGTNDVAGQAIGFSEFTLDLFARRMNAAAEEFAGSCVVVTTITTHRTLAKSNPPTDGYTPDEFNALAASYNAYLRATFAHVADWDAVVGLHPDYLPDEVHPFNSIQGLEALAATQIAAARGCP